MTAYKVISRIICSCCECNTSPAFVNGGPTDGAWWRGEAGAEGEGGMGQCDGSSCRITREAEAGIDVYSEAKGSS